jgi:hypothetical protein
MAKRSQISSPSDQTQASIRMRFKKMTASRQSDAWPVITPHAIDSKGEKFFGGHGFNHQKYKGPRLRRK